MLTPIALLARDTSIVDAHLVSEQSGWVLVADRLLWTNDLGANWKDITPSSGPERVNGTTVQVDGAIFLDKFTGWLALAQVDSTSTDTITLSIKRTVDGGTSWQDAALVPRKGSTFGLHWIGGALFSFYDRMQGWMLLPQISGSGVSLANLFITEDGGVSWKELPVPPAAGYIKFVTQTIGWISGGAFGDELYRTNDGGNTWTRQAVNPPDNRDSDIDTDTSPNLPGFRKGSMQQGVLPVIFSGPHDTVLVVYETSDAGANWQLQNRQGQFGPGQGVVVANPTDTVYWAHLMHGALITGSLPGSGPRRVTAPAFDPSTSAVTHYSVVDRSAFVLISQEPCNLDGTPCFHRTFLLATADGQQFIDRTPPLAKPVPMPPRRIVKPIRKGN